MPAYEYPQNHFSGFYLVLFVCVLDMTTKRCWLAHDFIFLFFDSSKRVDPLAACRLCVFSHGVCPRVMIVFYG
jgi:hypothetical protein